MIRSTRAALILLAAAALLAGCGGSDDDSFGGSADVDCSLEALGEDDTVEFLTAYLVVEGELADLCFGDEDDTVVDAFELLGDMTPPDQLRDLGIFAGFVGTEGGDEVTLAFVNATDPDDGSLFQMSINLDESDVESDEFALTLAHEFSHVFTATPSQLDRVADPESCDTYHNAEGCYADDSVMAQWIELFWGDGLIDEIDPEAEASNAAGEERCLREPSFLGAYAASSPEEDFAESFGAYVMQVEVDSPEVRDKLDWIDAQPGLREFRERAIEAGLGPAPNGFEGCG